MILGPVLIVCGIIIVALGAYGLSGAWKETETETPWYVEHGSQWDFHNERAQAALKRLDEAPNMRRLKPGEWKQAEVAYPTSRVEIGGVFFTVDNRLITKWENEDV